LQRVEKNAASDKFILDTKYSGKGESVLLIKKKRRAAKKRPPKAAITAIIGKMSPARIALIAARLNTSPSRLSPVEIARLTRRRK
jgi:hypothetical protein